MIKNYEELKLIKRDASGLTIVFGCFDILHYGHLNFIKKVSELAQSPIAIGVLPDSYVRATKGEDRPINGELDRLYAIDAACPMHYSFIVNERGDYNFYQKKLSLTNAPSVLWEYPIHALYQIAPTEFYYSTDFPITDTIKAVFAELNLKHQAVQYTEGISSTSLIEALKKQSD
ncbi:MAG: adenylyltransferase/cytidyltransferase family protein [Clostridia bacterium]|nr:adenylyltransferase/cytidyltransferase family protein [Clostridia bacterium]MBO7156414.1 adenylyltransferase/cytidyltransferase family protein [Clostridia bacterium]